MEDYWVGFLEFLLAMERAQAILDRPGTLVLSDGLPSPCSDLPALWANLHIWFRVKRIGRGYSIPK